MSLFKQATTLLFCLRRNYSQQTKKYFEKSVSLVSLMGRIGTEPRMAETKIFNPDDEDAQQVVVFSLGTLRLVDQEEKYVTDWHRICVFDENLKKFIEEKNIDKGDKVFIRGRLQYNSIRENGKRVKNIPVIIARNLLLVSSSRENEEAKKMGLFT